MARYCQAIHGHQAIHGWPGPSADGLGPPMAPNRAKELFGMVRKLRVMCVESLCKLDGLFDQPMPSTQVGRTFLGSISLPLGMDCRLRFTELEEFP